MGAIASQITSLTIVYSTVYSGADQRKHQSSASLVFVWGIHRGPVNSPHKGPVTRKMFPSDDVIMYSHISDVRYLFIHTFQVNTKNRPCLASLSAWRIPTNGRIFHWLIDESNWQEMIWFVDRFINLRNRADIHIFFISWDPFQYPIRCIIVMSLEFLMQRKW